MYKFITIKGSCGAPYDIASCEGHANKMLSDGYELVQVYQTTTAQCLGQKSSILVMIFKKQN